MRYILLRKCCLWSKHFFIFLPLSGTVQEFHPSDNFGSHQVFSRKFQAVVVRDNFQHLLTGSIHCRKGRIAHVGTPKSCFNRKAGLWLAELTIYLYLKDSQYKNDATQLKNFLGLKLPPFFPSPCRWRKKAAISKSRSFSTELHFKENEAIEKL